MLQHLTAAEALMISEALRGAVASCRSAAAEASKAQDPELRQLLQAEAERHRRAAQRLQAIIGTPNH